jgi:hypothetical protein
MVYPRSCTSMAISTFGRVLYNRQRRRRMKRVGVRSCLAVVEHR